MKLPQPVVSAKNFVIANKTKIQLTTIVILTGAVVMGEIGIKQHNDFLKEHDLYDAFYAQVTDEI